MSERESLTAEKVVRVTSLRLTRLQMLREHASGCFVDGAPLLFTLPMDPRVVVALCDCAIHLHAIDPEADALSQLDRAPASKELLK